MLVRIAHRLQGTTTIQTDESGEKFFIEGAFYDIVYLEEDKLLLISRTDDEKATRCTYGGGAYRKSGITRQLIKSALPVGFPAFTMSVDNFNLDGDLLIWERPPIWELKWCHTTPSGARDAALHNFETRLKSAQKNGVDLRRVTEAVPRWARLAIGPESWSKLIREYSRV